MVFFKHIPNTLITIITTYTNELFGCINEFETRYRKLRHEFKSKIYSFVIDKEMVNVCMIFLKKGKA